MARHEEESRRFLYEKEAKTKLEGLNQEIKGLKGQLTTSEAPHEKTFRDRVAGLDDRRLRIETMLEALEEAPPEKWEAGRGQVDVAINDLQKEIKTVESERHQ